MTILNSYLPTRSYFDCAMKVVPSTMWETSCLRKWGPLTKKMAGISIGFPLFISRLCHRDQIMTSVSMLVENFVGECKRKK